MQKTIAAGISATVLLSGMAFPLRDANAQTTTIHVFGRDWLVKDSGPTNRLLGPGPNIFRTSNVVVDEANDDLHLFITKSGNVWTCAEVIGVDATGFGTYSWDLATPIHTVDPSDNGVFDVPQVVLGMFTWSDKGNHTEIDVEVGHFDPNHFLQNLWHSVQPTSKSYAVSEWGASTHMINWASGFVNITSTPTSVNPGATFPNGVTSTFTRRIPTPLRTTSPHINFWLRGGQPPTVPSDVTQLEVVITDFNYSR